MTSFYKDTAVYHRRYFFGSFYHIVCIFYFKSAEDLGFGYIGSYYRTHGKKLCNKRFAGFVAEEFSSACRYHNGVNNDIFGIIFFQLIYYDVYYFAVRYHSYFNGVGTYILKYAVKLFCNKFGRNVHKVVHSHSVLSNDRCNNAHGVLLMYGYCFQVCLLSRTSRGVCSGYCKNLFYFGSGAYDFLGKGKKLFSCLCYVIFGEYG